MTYMVLPFMQPGKRSLTSAFRSSGDIQLPRAVAFRLRRPLAVPASAKPDLGMGIVSSMFVVLMTVRSSTRATSFGSVSDSQLENEKRDLLEDLGTKSLRVACADWSVRFTFAIESKMCIGKGSHFNGE